jgi:hypothetical protein
LRSVPSKSSTEDTCKFLESLRDLIPLTSVGLEQLRKSGRAAHRACASPIYIGPVGPRVYPSISTGTSTGLEVASEGRTFTIERLIRSTQSIGTRLDHRVYGVAISRRDQTDPVQLSSCLERRILTFEYIPLARYAHKIKTIFVAERSICKGMRRRAKHGRSQDQGIEWGNP